MLALGVLVVGAFLPASVDAATFREGHPIESVITMLQDMSVKAKDQHAEEKASYAKFEYWCKHADADLSKSIAAREERLKIVEDKISSTKLEIEGLEEDIEKLTGEIEERQGANEKAEKIREEQNKDYEDEKKDLEETIAAFKEALTALEPHAAAASAIQMSRPEVQKALRLSQETSARSRARAARRVGVAAEPIDAKGTGRVEVYKSKSGEVVDMLKNLLEDFERQLVKNEQEETNALNAYALAKQAQDYAISEAEEAKEAKTTMKADAGVTLSGLELEQGQDKDALEAETKALDGAKTDCDTRAAEWEERTKTRELEMAAIAKAVEILGKVVHVRNPDTHEIPARSGGGAGAAAFIQMGAAKLVDGPKQKAVNLLKKEASKVHSKSLQKLAEAIANTSGPFDKITQMIQKMIFRLMAEQKDEDAHKAWCDAELDKSEESKSDKEDKLEILTGKIDSAKTKVSVLTEDIAANTEEVAKLDAYIQEETQTREENKKENKAAVKDAKDAQVAIAKAVEVLKEFYKGTGEVPKESWEFFQRRAPEAVTLPEQPSTWDAGYTGVEGEDGKPASAGVLAMLDEINTKFATMEAETKAQEETDEKDYLMDMADQKALKRDTEKESELKADQKATLIQKLDAMNTQKRHLAGELEAVVKYLKDLEPACVTGDSSYEERKQARTDEIDALKQALSILEDAFKKEGFLQRPGESQQAGA